MKRYKIVSVLVLIAAVVFSVATLGLAADKPGEKLRFVSICAASTNLSAIDMNEGAREVLTAAGAEFKTMYYENDMSVMIEMIENAVTARYDGMILQNVSNFEAGEDSIRQALKQGMVIVEYDGDYEQIEEIQYWFGGSNYQIGYAIGQMAGEWANEVLVPKGIEVIAGSFDYRDIDYFAERSDGVIDGLRETCPQVNIVREERVLSTVEGMTIAENWLQAYPNLNIIVGLADMFVLGGAEAFAASGKDPQLNGCFAADAVDAALEQIATGGMYKGTLNLDLRGVGEMAGQFMLDYINGIQVEGRTKYNYFPMIAITEKNIDNYYLKD